MKISNTLTLRVYGDNILECEKTLDLIFKSIKLYNKSSSLILEKNAPVFCPKYLIKSDNNTYKLQLFPGYKRWSSNIIDKLNAMGATLNEEADSIVTLYNNDEETILFGCEYCGALPAGNNVWQRSGRALLFAEAKIPFLYYSEIGGVELDNKRNIKSSRLPNPLVPYSYITVNDNYENSTIVPIYNQSPTISEENFELYRECFSEGEDLHLIYSLLTKDYKYLKTYCDILLEKAYKLTGILIENRSRNDTISSDNLSIFTNFINTQKSHVFLENVNMSWAKSISIDLTKTIRKLFDYCLDNGIAMGSKTMPFCFLAPMHKKFFLKIITDSNIQDTTNLDNISNSNKPLAIIWIAGFKPRGDDSRPDRGLLPLFRMLYGSEYDVLTIIYGPMKKTAINLLIERPINLSQNNGLWRSIFTQSDYVLVDNYEALSNPQNQGASVLLSKNDFFYDFSQDIDYTPCKDIPAFNEHDIDTAIHSIFDTYSKNKQCLIFECFCNPPGGDWSGIKVYDKKNRLFYRWSSLPRVSGIEKRPDHLIQFLNTFIVIESKFQGSDVEKNIGPRLKNYISNLFSSMPNSYSDTFDLKWRFSSELNLDTSDFNILSAIAYYLDDINNVDYIIDKTNVDIVFAIKFIGYKTIIYIITIDIEIEKWLKNVMRKNSNIEKYSKEYLEIIWL